MWWNVRWESGSGKERLCRIPHLKLTWGNVLVRWISRIGRLLNWVWNDSLLLGRSSAYWLTFWTWHLGPNQNHSRRRHLQARAWGVNTVRFPCNVGWFATNNLYNFGTTFLAVLIRPSRSNSKVPSWQNTTRKGLRKLVVVVCAPNRHG